LGQKTGEVGAANETGGVKVDREDLNEKQRIIIEMLDALVDVGDTWETSKAIEEWVNDNFYPETYDVIDISMDDVGLENVRLGWK